MNGGYMKIIDIDSLDGHQFEVLVEQLIQKMGFLTEERKFSVDGGIDILATSDRPMFRGKYVIQCKRHNAPIGEPVLRDLFGTVHALGANKGILITNSTFTDLANRFAENKPLELIDGKTLLQMLSKYGIFEIEDKGKARFHVPSHVALFANLIIPKMEELQEKVEKIDKRKKFVKKKYINILTLFSSFETFSKIFEDYLIFINETFNSINPKLSSKSEVPLDEITSDAKEIIKATEIIVNEYIKFRKKVPPKSVKGIRILKIYQFFLEYINCILNTIFDIAPPLRKILSNPLKKDYNIILNLGKCKKKQEKMFRELSKLQEKLSLHQKLYGISWELDLN